MLNHDYIGTEHLLLGLIGEDEGVASRALETMGISPDAVRQEVLAMVGEGQTAPTGHIPFTPRAKKVLELALREALQLGHNYIGTEHILLGLAREEEGVAAKVLTRLGADLDRVRETVIELLSGYVGSSAVAEAAGGTPEYAERTTEEASGAEPVGFARPNCPRCHAALADTLTVGEIETNVNDDAISLKVAYCGRCGSALGLLP
jgi:ATP-dependent Clp protease ATP-binding subunit ClpC